MNQEKIGKFISELRKSKNMTQQDLANKLGVTDRAISKWENGRGLPDYSLVKNLCAELGITVNDLLNGEITDKKESQEKLEQNVVNTINYTSKRINRSKLVIGIILFVVLVFAICFLVDLRQMRNNEPVVFSTWGFEYYPPINLDEEKIEKAIKEYFISEDEKNSYYDGEKSFAAVKIYLIGEEDDKTVAYAWILGESYYKDGDEVKQDSGYSIPHKIKLIKDKDSFKVVSYEIPGDGTQYEKDMKKLFPNKVLRDMDKFYFDGSSEKLQLEIDEQVELYFSK